MADAIVVLGEGRDPLGRLSEISKSRIESGAFLFHNGVSSRIIMSGWYDFLLLDDIPLKAEASAMKEYAQSLEVPDESIIVEERSKDTLGSAYFTKTYFLRPNSWKDIHVVTSDYNMLRTEYIFRRVLGPEYSIRFAESASWLSYDELDRKLYEELKLISLTEDLLYGIQDGDDASIGHLIHTKHPAYAQQPVMSREDIIRMMSGA